jgi:1,2-diacylglycerol 3-beta-glucosyltransferase
MLAVLRQIVLVGLWMLAAFSGLCVAYLMTLTLAALWQQRRIAWASSSPATRFLVLIPAHNEETLLPELLSSLKAMDYPPSLYEVHVVADNCTDATASTARQYGVHVHERYDDTALGKGHALNWLQSRLASKLEPGTAVLILDADSTPSPNLLQVMDAHLSAGEDIVQAYYMVRGVEHSWPAAMRALALCMIHYVRPMGRMALGGSCGLKGNGMVFASEMLGKGAWSEALAEDAELHVRLLLNGRRVTFAPDAVVAAEMPSSLTASRSQNVRWERGRLEVARAYLLPLLSKAWRERRWLYADAAIELLTPPLSLIGVALAIPLLGGALLSAPALAWSSAAVTMLLAVHVVSAPLIAQAPLRVLAAGFYAPIYAAWKLWLYVRVVAGKDRAGWTRTPRNAPPEARKP